MYFILKLLIVFSFTSCAFHGGYLSNLSLSHSEEIVKTVKSHSATTRVLWVGGLSKDALVLEAKNNLLKSIKLKEGERLSNFIVDYKNEFYLVVNKLKVTLSADIISDHVKKPKVNAVIILDNSISRVVVDEKGTDSSSVHYTTKNGTTYSVFSNSKICYKNSIAIDSNRIMKSDSLMLDGQKYYMEYFGVNKSILRSSGGFLSIVSNATLEQYSIPVASIKSSVSSPLVEDSLDQYFVDVSCNKSIDADGIYLSFDNYIYEVKVLNEFEKKTQVEFFSKTCLKTVKTIKKESLLRTKELKVINGIELTNAATVNFVIKEEKKRGKLLYITQDLGVIKVDNEIYVVGWQDVE